MQRTAFLLVLSAFLPLALLACKRTKAVDETVKFVESNQFDPKVIFCDRLAKALGYESFSMFGNLKRPMKHQKEKQTQDGERQVIEHSCFSASTFEPQPRKPGFVVFIDFIHYADPDEAESSFLTGRYLLSANPWRNQTTMDQARKPDDFCSEDVTHGCFEECTYTAGDIKHAVVSLTFCLCRFVVRISVGNEFKTGATIRPKEAKAEAERIARGLIPVIDRMNQ